MEYEKKFPSFDHRRLELLFTVPDELITAPDGGFVLGPYVKTPTLEDPLRTVWAIEAKCDKDKKNIPYLIRNDSYDDGEKRRRVELPLQGDNPIEYIVSDSDKLVSLKTDKKGTVDSLSISLDPQAEPYDERHSGVFHYGPDMKLKTCSIQIIPENRSLDEEVRSFDDPSDYYKTRRFEVNLEEYAIKFMNMCEMSEWDEDAEDGEEDGEETTDTAQEFYESNLVDMGFKSPEVQDKVGKLIEGHIENVVKKFIPDLVPSDILPGFTKDILFETVEMLKVRYHEDTILISDLLRSQSIFQAISEALVQMLAVEVDLAVSNDGVEIDMVFLEHEVMYSVKLGRSQSYSQTRAYGEEFTYDGYRICADNSNGQVEIGMMHAIQGTQRDKFILPPLNAQVFYDKVSNPFSSGVDAVDTIGARFVSSKKK
jgi:hypothetical protein